METKKQIRREILSIRDALSKEERKKKSDKIKKQLAELPAFEQADQILIYASFGSEVETDAIMELAFRKRKLVFCPRVEGKKMQFYQITDLSQLVSGYRGIREPQPERPWQQRPGDLVIMPGTVFDREGNRIGYGGGFYDRFLEAHPQVSTAAVAYELQLVEAGRIETEETDQKPACIVTEKMIYQTEMTENN